MLPQQFTIGNTPLENFQSYLGYLGQRSRQLPFVVYCVISPYYRLCAFDTTFRLDVVATLRLAPEAGGIPMLTYKIRVLLQKAR
jgi:hypothetical protein